MRKHILLLLSLLLSGTMVLWADGEPGFWTEPFPTGVPEDDTPDPDFWVNPFLSDDMVDNLPEPEPWMDPFAGELLSLEYDLTDLGLPADIDEVISQSTALTVNVHRNLVGGMYNTLCLPFDVPSLIGTPLDYAQVLEFEYAAMENGNLSIYFQYVDAMQAGKPYLVLPAMDIPSPMQFTGVVLSASEGETCVGEQVNFIGILEPYVIPNDGQSLFLGANNRLYYSNAAGTMRGLRAYFFVNPAVALSPARLCIGRRPVATAIGQQNAQTAARKYIANGQFVIRRDNQEYNALGIGLK